MSPRVLPLIFNTVFSVLVSSHTRTRYKFDICKLIHLSIGRISALRNSCFIICSLFYQRYFFICGIWHFALSAYRTCMSENASASAAAATADKHVLLHVCVCYVYLLLWAHLFIIAMCAYVLCTSLYRHSLTDSLRTHQFPDMCDFFFHSCFFVRFWFWYCALCVRSIDRFYATFFS